MEKDNNSEGYNISMEELRRQIEETIRETSSMISDKKSLEEMSGDAPLKPKTVKIDTADTNIVLETDKPKKKRKEAAPVIVSQGIISKCLERVLHESMIPYTEHVVLDRAIPRVEDGLKPVQRRILYTMLELGLEPDKAYRKCARIVGDCMGKYHPHGDRSVYDAMVRMAQPHSMSETLVLGHGNFGSIDGDPAAAMRYTEAKMTPLAIELLRDLEKNTVPWQLNFDDSLKEPILLPGRFPNLLVNGASGIAVGVATNIPPHNLSEVIDGVVSFIDNPNIQLSSLMRIIKAPDFPTGGIVIAQDELKDAYRTGRGKIHIRAKVHLESSGDKDTLVITEMPYQVNKANLLQKIAMLQQENKGALGQIQEIRDESDRSGMRAIIRLRKDSDPKSVLESLFKHTELQTSFGINMVAIAAGKPRQMGIIEIISHYTEFQRKIIYNRSKFDLDESLKRSHVIEGLIIAIQNIDEVIRIIKKSGSVSEAKVALKQRFSLSEIQAQAILDMRLARLTNLEIKKLQDEFDQLQELIAKLRKICASKNLQFSIVREEILEIKKKFGSKRKSEIVSSFEIKNIEANELANIKESILGITALGTIKKMPPKSYSMAQREINESSELCEIHTELLLATSVQIVLCFTKNGHCVKVNWDKISEMKWRDKGILLRELDSNISSEDSPVSFVIVDESKPEQNLIFVTKDGLVKRTSVTEFFLKKSSAQALKLKKGDEILNVFIEEEGKNICMVNSGGNMLFCSPLDLPLQGRVTSGVKGINLDKNEKLVFAKLMTEKDNIVVLSAKGFAKNLSLSEIEIMTRGRKGTRIFKFEKEKDSIIFVGKSGKNMTIALQGANKFDGKESFSIPFETKQGSGKQIFKTVPLAIYSYLKNY